MKTEQRWRRDAFSGLRITCRAMPAPGNTLISASCSEDTWGWTWLAGVTSSSVSQLLAIPLGSRNVYEDLQVSQIPTSPYFPSDLPVSLVFWVCLLPWRHMYLACSILACPWHFLNTSGPSSVGHLGPKFSTRRDRNNGRVKRQVSALQSEGGTSMACLLLSSAKSVV